MRDSKLLLCLAATVVLIPGTRSKGADNLLADPSFEVTKSKDQFGLVFARWGGWKYEGDCEFRVGDVARTGKHSCLLYGGIGAKIRVSQNVELTPGRYRVTAYLRGLDIGKGTYNATTEFMFDGKYQQLNKNGTFGWTKLTYVGEIKERKQAGPSFGLMAPGYFWIDDVALEKVGNDVSLTEAPVLGTEEAPIAPPGEIMGSAVRCSECGYRNNPDVRHLLRLRHRGSRHGRVLSRARRSSRWPRSRMGIRFPGAPWSACMRARAAKPCGWIGLSPAWISLRTGGATTFSRRTFTPTP